MKRFLLIYFLLFSNSAFARHYNSQFYVGVDSSQTNDKIGKIDNSVSLNTKEKKDQYYGYKFNGGGFFVAPEISIKRSQNLKSKEVAEASDSVAATNTGYDVKANIGYDFNKSVSGFVTYDLGSFTYQPGQTTIKIGANKSITSVVGFGSKFSISDNLGLKIMYSQREFESSNSGSGRIKSDIVNVGTVYSF